MADTTQFPLQLSAARLADFCRQLRRRSTDPALALQLLTTLQAFIGTCAVDNGHPGYRRARDELDAQLDELRTALLEQHAAQIGSALRLRDSDALARSFTALSRSGFADAARRAWAMLEPPVRSAGRDWLHAWTLDVRQRAETASRYPDAPDFRAAGIALETYLALEELRGVAEKFDCGTD